MLTCPPFAGQNVLVGNHKGGDTSEQKRSQLLGSAGPTRLCGKGGEDQHPGSLHPSVRLITALLRGQQRHRWPLLKESRQMQGRELHTSLRESLSKAKGGKRGLLVPLSAPSHHVELVKSQHALCPSFSQCNKVPQPQAVNYARRFLADGRCQQHLHPCTLFPPGPAQTLAHWLSKAGRPTAQLQDQLSPVHPLLPLP